MKVKDLTKLRLPRDLVCYYRVSDPKQGESGLGLEAQQQMVRIYRRTRSGSKVIGEYTEVETGTLADRPALKAAIAHARRAGATLVVAKLDRLARNVAFTSAVMDSGVDFVCCDQPYANRLTLHILAAVAEWEVEQIRERTKAALAAYKARGGKLGAARPGAPKLTPEAAQKGRLIAGALLKKRTDEIYADLIPTLREWLPICTFEEIADMLNGMGHRTSTGGYWHECAVRRVCARFKLIDMNAPWGKKRPKKPPETAPVPPAGTTGLDDANPY